MQGKSESVNRDFCSVGTSSLFRHKTENNCTQNEQSGIFKKSAQGRPSVFTEGVSPSTFLLAPTE
jgi:hypothetical protein